MISGLTNNGVCGLETFNWLKQRCCSGKLHKRKKNQGCCGDEVIDTSLYWCDDDDNVISYKQTCNDQLYDTRMGICCGGHVHNFSAKTPYLSCCVSRIFYPMTEKCEREQVVPIGYRWCGEGKSCIDGFHNNFEKNIYLVIFNRKSLVHKTI